MLVKRGSRGEEVVKLQKLLGLKEDGIFGINTEEKVRYFQHINELTVDGIVGDNTYSLLIKKTTIFPLLDKLDTHIPAKVLFELPKTMETFNITTILRLSHFLSQCSHESANFKYTEENLNYSSNALLSVFGKYFTISEAGEYHRKPEQIANRVYSDRMGNGSEQSGDGWKYRGRGYIQLTGKNNYSLFNEYIEDAVVENPELVATKYPLLSAGWYWGATDLNRYADQGSDKETIIKVTRRINGGTNGLLDRVKKFDKFFDILNN